VKLFRDLKVKLTDAEWRSYVDAWAREQSKAHETQAEKAQAMADFKGRIERHENTMNDLGEKVRSHEETRAVECVNKPDEQRFVMELYRTDTGELVETRAMSAAERHEVVQATLPGVSKAPPGDN
jgi:hypothetical protein